MNIAREYSAWKRKQPDIACLFAGQIAMKPDRYGQVIQVAGGSADNSKMLAHNLSMRIDRLVKDPLAHAAAILFPQLTTLKAAAAVFLELRGRPEWSVTTTAVADQGNGPSVAVHVVRLGRPRARPRRWCWAHLKNFRQLGERLALVLRYTWVSPDLLTQKPISQRQRRTWLT